MREGRHRPEWHQWAIILAQAAASRSEDPYTQVGACVLRADHSVASVGYNGPPPGVEVDWSDRDARRPKMIHAEMNALRYVHPGEAHLLAVTMMPCAECLKNVAAFGIQTVVYGESFTNQAVYDDTAVKALAVEFGVDLIQVPPVQPIPMLSD